MLTELAGVVETVTREFEEYDYARALQLTERFFWTFCDDYLELVKERAYGESDDTAANSARAALATALSTLLRLFAPFLPFTTEEVWSWWQPGSVHRASWPTPSELGDITAGDGRALTAASEVMRAVRKAKSDAKLSMRAEIASLTVRGNHDALMLFKLAERDVQAAGRIRDVHTAVMDTTDGKLIAEVTL
jgi:valyl-tRNA synthetase